MNTESELKHKSYYIEFYAKMANDHVESLKECSDKLVVEIEQIQTEMKMLREQNKKLKAALERIGTGELITTQRGTIFIDREETATLQDFVSDVLKECRL